MQRPLSPAEIVLWQVGAHAGNNVVAHAVWQNADAAVLERRLAALGRAFPLLAAHVTWRAGTLCFVSEPGTDLPVRNQPQRHPVDPVLEIEHELNVQFAPLHPLTRAVVLQDGTATHVLLTCHQAVGDSASLITLLRHMLSQAETPCAPMLAPPLEAVLPPSHRGWGIKRRVATLLPRTLLRTMRPAHAWPSASAATMARSAVWTERLELADLHALRARAEHEQASLHGLLCASLLQGAARVLGEPNARLGCLGAVNLRPFLDTDAAAVGFYSGGVTTYHRVHAQHSVWALARAYTARWKQVTQQRAALTGSWFYRWLADEPDARVVTARCNRVVRAAVAVSNLGTVDLGPQPPGWSLQSLHVFVATHGWPSRALTSVLATSPHGCDISYIAAAPHPVAARAAEVLAATQEVRRAALT